MAVMTARLINGGRAVKPKLLKFEGEMNQFGPSLKLNPRHLKIVMDGMNRVTNGSRGTARKVPNPSSDFNFGGKSGSVQVKRISLNDRFTGKIKNEDRPWNERDHAMFVAYTPVKSPRYVTAVVVEHGGGGSTMAAPIARDILEQTIRLDPSRF
jgi:penicillin-binding protein 2